MHGGSETPEVPGVSEHDDDLARRCNDDSVHELGVMQ